MYESFERQITGLQETTTKDDVYEFLEMVFSDNTFRDMLKEISNKKVSTEEDTENVDTEKYAD